MVVTCTNIRTLTAVPLTVVGIVIRFYMREQNVIMIAAMLMLMLLAMMTNVMKTIMIMVIAIIAA